MDSNGLASTASVRVSVTREITPIDDCVLTCGTDIVLVCPSGCACREICP